LKKDWDDSVTIVECQSKVPSRRKRNVREKKFYVQGLAIHTRREVSVTFILEKKVKRKNGSGIVLRSY